MSRLLFVVLFFVLLSEPAYSWHPGFHVHLVRYAIEQALLPAGLLELARQSTNQFLYGSVIPDRFMGKGELDETTRHPQHDETAYAMFRRARSKDGRAFAAGYLLHLRADRVAHGSFLPGRTDPTNRLRHVSHELAMEAYVTDEDLGALSRIMSEGALRDELLQGLALDYPVETPFHTPLFHMGLRVSAAGPWRRMAHAINAFERFHVSDSSYERYRDEALELMGEPV